MATGFSLYHINPFKKRKRKVEGSPFSYSCLLLCPDNLFRSKGREHPHTGRDVGLLRGKEAGNVQQQPSIVEGLRSLTVTDL